MANTVIDEVLDKKLVEQTAQVGDVLYEKLAALAGKYPALIQNLRGRARKLILLLTPLILAVYSSSPRTMLLC
ncbi:hypothetical protein BDV25DRAFT_145337 [Aspergillus avenaceus]|uniref:Uncharacterized protein n=1 Tax=Aspergillus avenaceus TaxID=36643 RepID=A0A5N6TED2_ASPAV|nr:hypothetical protein BDV25DRAFT_145337 [Aspergillus avenaceus]